MSEEIKHECGIALIRLLKPLSHYISKYNTPLYGVNKLYLLMEKQHNRGQDGVGVASIDFDASPGESYIYTQKSIDSHPIASIFGKIQKDYEAKFLDNPQKRKNAEWIKKNVDSAGDIYLGHLRYGTHGKNDLSACHPFIRENNWKSKSLVLAGNFNMTNNAELMQLLIDLGQHPRAQTDTETVLEKFGHFLDEENELLYREYRKQGYSKKEISGLIARNLPPENVLRNAAQDFDGGYAIAGLIGHGDAFVLRDPSGIRPAYYYKDDEILVVASERPAIQTTFNLPFESIPEIKPGNALIVKKDGRIYEEEILKPKKLHPCSFERIYFSRGTDADIYRERKKLGELMCDDVLKAIDYDFENTVFSYIPNTAETAFLGLVKSTENHLNAYKQKEILNNRDISEADLKKLMEMRTRVEKIAVKDAKLRTFITQDEDRDDLVAHVYDSTYGIVKPNEDNLVILDDSIVRGTTLKKSIIKILDRLKPKKIVVVSSAPQIRYPDCYGIDMSKLKDFIAFRAAIALLKERNMEYVLEETYHKCKSQLLLKDTEVQNFVKDIYNPFSAKEISDKIAEIIKPETCHAEIQVIYQSIHNLHQAIPIHKGDWYFTGNFPTPGGMRVVNRAFINYYEGVESRAY